LISGPDNISGLIELPALTDYSKAVTVAASAVMKFDDAAFIV